MDSRDTCECCGKRLPFGRKRFCCAECTLKGVNSSVSVARYECRMCGAKMFVKTSDALCAVCRDLLEQRSTNRAAADAIETAIRLKEQHKAGSLAQWRSKSRCYRCVYATPIYENVVFCPSCEGTCIYDEQIERKKGKQHD